MTFKSIMLGAAAVATAATTATAADLPVAPEPVDYVQICDAYGDRFFYIPGTDICLRVRGRARTTISTENLSDDVQTAGFNNRTSDGITWTTEGFIYLDARNETEWGTLRTFIELEGNVSDNTEAFDTGNVFIQWGGLLVGYTGSQFDHYTGQVEIGVVGRQWSDTTTQQISYTMNFGDGFYATASIEDRVERDNNAPITNTVALVGGGTATLSTTTSGNRVPDFVAKLGVTQGWGAAAISGAIHQVYPAATRFAVSGVAGGEDELGWAVGGSVLFNLPMIANGGNIFFQGFYANGALSYIGYTPTTTGAVRDSNGVGGLSSGYSLSSGISIDATDTIQLNLDGSYASVDPAAGLGGDVTRWVVDGGVTWQPVNGLRFAADAGYANTDVTGGADVDDYRLGVRIRRDF